MNEVPIDRKLELVHSLFKRGNLRQIALSRFKEKFPNASENIIDSLAFHLYVDGHDALLNLLCELELFLKGDIEDIGYGNVDEIIYHLYNFRLLESIMPETAQGVIDDIEEIKDLLKEETPDIKGILKSLDELQELIEGHISPPDEI